MSRAKTFGLSLVMGFKQLRLGEAWMTEEANGTIRWDSRTKHCPKTFGRQIARGKFGVCCVILRAKDDVLNQNTRRRKKDNGLDERDIQEVEIMTEIID